MLALTQKEIPPETGKQREPFISIGLHVMKVECNRTHRVHQVCSNQHFNRLGKLLLFIGN